MREIRFLGLLLAIVVLPSLVSAEGARVEQNDSQGQLHVVVDGDTLWDITAHYLGTPWLWPSIWNENADIQNPHLIYPGDLIWITQGSMRKVTAEEAAELLEPEISEPAEPPAAPAPEPEDVAPDPFASLDQGESVTERLLRYPGLHRFGWVTPDQMAGAGAVLGTHEEHYWVAQRQRTIVSLGEGQVNVGDVYSVFRVRRRVIHPETGRILGYFTQNLGKAEIAEIHPEASYVEIVTAYAEIEPGDRIRPYVAPPTEIVEQTVREHIKGTIVAQQPYRIYSAWNDFVVLDRGSSDGVEPGYRFNVYREGREVSDPLTRTKILVPDDVIGSVFVVSVTPTTALALITHAARKIHEGDRFRDI